MRDNLYELNAILALIENNFYSTNKKLDELGRLHELWGKLTSEQKKRDEDNPNIPESFANKMLISARIGPLVYAPSHRPLLNNNSAIAA